MHSPTTRDGVDHSSNTRTDFDAFAYAICQVYRPSLQVAKRSMTIEHSMFSHSSLNHDDRDIRLLRFIRHNNGEAHNLQPSIKLELQHASINDEGIHYAALSYVWGDVHDTIDAYIDGSAYPIGRNLHRFLEQLWRDDVTSWLWIDSICINQANLTERRLLVDMMGDIYSRADSVYAWLGPGTVESDRVLDFVVHMGPRAYTPTAFAASMMAISRSNHVGDLEKWMVPEVKEYLWKRWDSLPEEKNIPKEVKGAADMDRREEVNAPEKRNLRQEENLAEQEDMLEEESMPEEDNIRKQESSLNFPELSRLYEDLLNEDGLHSRRGMEVHQIERPVSASIGSLIPGIEDILTRDYWSRIWIIQEVSLGEEVVLMCGEKSVSINVFDAVFSAIWACRNYRPCYWDYLSYAWDLDDNLYNIKALIMRRLHSRGARVRLLDIFFEPGVSPGRPHYSASDPRDILFGLLGIISDAERFGLHADYAKPVEAVFAALTAALIRMADEQEDSDCTTPFHDFHLDWYIPPLVPSLWPSWVPDWQKYGMLGIGESLHAISYKTDLNATKNVAVAPSTSSSGIDSQDLMVLRRRGCRVDVIMEVMAYREMSVAQDCDISFTEADMWLNSVLKFAGLGPEPGPEEDYVWRSIIRGENSWKLDAHSNEEKNLSFVRKIMRGHYISKPELTPVQVFFAYNNSGSPQPNYTISDDDIAEAGRRWRHYMADIHRWRTVFKTSKGMFGVCYLVVEPGDIVTLLWGVRSPIILKPRQGGGYLFKGDSYVDGIMNGEFLETNPIHEDFDIH